MLFLLVFCLFLPGNQTDGKLDKVLDTKRRLEKQAVILNNAGAGARIYWHNKMGKLSM